MTSGRLFLVWAAVLIGSGCAGKPKPHLAGPKKAPGGVSPIVVAEDTLMILEAESGKVAGKMRVVTSSRKPGKPDNQKASAGKFIEIPKGVNPKNARVAADASYQFGIQRTGEYWIWARVYWQGGCWNSLRQSVDKATPIVFGEDGDYRRWHWVRFVGKGGRPQRFTLVKGTHALVISNNEDGTKVDQILITDDREYVPTAIESTGTE